MSPIVAERTPAQAKSNENSTHDASQRENEGGMTIARNPESPSGQFGMPVQMQAAPDAVIQRKPSDEVPDLDEEVVKKINEALKAADKQKALDLVLDALVAKDATTFNKDFLVGKKLGTRSGTTSVTSRGPKFKTWLTDELAKGPADIKTDAAACKKYMATLKVPAGLPDIQIKIGSDAMTSAPNVYTTVRHEYIHLQQIMKDPMAYIPTSDWPAGYANPSEDSKGNLMEVEAYLWEAENITQTGLEKDPQALWNLRKQLNTAWGGTNVSDSKTLEPRWKAAMSNLWKTATSIYIGQAETMITKAGTGTMADADFTKLEEIWGYIGNLWGFKQYNATEAATLQPRYDKVKAYVEGAKATKAAAEFGKKMTEAETKFKSARSGYDGYNIFDNLYDAWEALDAKGQATHEAAFKKVMVPIWVGSFDMMDTRMKELYKKDKDDDNLTDYANSMLKMLRKATQSGVDAKTKEAKQAILDKWKKDLGLR